MQTLSALAFEFDVDVAEDCIDEIVHPRLLKFASVSRLAAELGRSSDFSV